MFTFELNYTKQSILTKVLVIFSDSETLDESEYVEFFEDAYKRHLRPDHVVYLFPGYIRERVSSLFLDRSLALSSATRFGDKVPFSLVSYNHTGNIECLNNSLWAPDELSDFRKKACREGLLILARENGVIELAPPGTTFKKPSEREDKEFLSASKLCSGSCEESFVSFCILPKLPKEISRVRKVLIDTQSISYIVNNIALTLKKFGQNVQFSHESFSSYSGIEKNKPDDVSSTIIIISASTTNSLMTELEVKWGTPKENIITLLSYADRDRVLSDISSLSSFRGKKFSSDRHVKRIGEHFTAEIFAPKAVLIKKIHGDKILKAPFKELYNLRAFRCHKTKTGQSTRREFNVDLNFDDSDINQKISEWLLDLAKGHIPSSTKWIVIDKQDPVSERLATEIMRNISKDESSLSILDFKEAIDIDFGNSKDALIAFAPVIGSGNIFMSLNRDLRIAKHDGMRIFATLLHLYKGEKQKDQFRKSLVYGPNFSQYKFFARHEINMPARYNKSSWDLESKLILNFQEDYEFWGSRYNTLSQGSVGLGGLVGISGCGADKPLTFSRHFAFWSFEYNEESVTPEAVYFMVASVLQWARDNKDLDSSDSLSGDIYQQAVLDPEVFVRYNDPLLQSCLWRAANNSELDYSSDEVLSGQFADILLRLLDHHDNDKGEASIDILVGMAVEKIKLNKESMLRVIEKLQTMSESACYVKPLLDELNGLTN
ncbi:hypothetical protein E0E54_13040 [Azotobacter chroococcum]|uniref:hypothetical protein n=1 Tax=Azotobacter chroococcum TaxID=353 RepID=UPI00103B7AA0|nr:hypothetical protein [Azotobacter chroococcum]TBW35037.1 hypothetical protein E0E54_13040 [Azotobacter chroococcum]